MPEHKTIGEEIRDKRKSLGWSQAEFAERLNNYAFTFNREFCKTHGIKPFPRTSFNKDTISRWEADKHEIYFIHFGFVKVVFARHLKTNRWINRKG